MITTDPRQFFETIDICAKWDDSVIGRDGTVYPKLAFDSPLHQSMALALRDHDKADLIWKSYQSLLLPFLQMSDNGQTLFERWLINHLFLITNCHDQHLNELSRIDGLAPFLPQISQFLTAIRPPSTHQIEKKNRPFRVGLVMTSEAGGELMVAQAIEDYLRYLSFDVFSIDIKSIERNESDILFRFSGMYSVDIYGEIFQKENNQELAGELWWKCDQLRYFIPDNSALILKEEMCKFEPDLILTTRYFSPRDVTLAYDLNVPLRFIHCDYRFSPDLLPLAPLVDSQLTKFWVPTSRCIPSEISNKIEVLGYPIRLAIKRAENPLKRAALKKELGIKEDERVVFMMMGRQGMGKTLLPLIQEIISDDSLGPLHVVVVCGNNALMKEEICAYLGQRPHSQKRSFKVHGFLDENSISSYYNVSDVYAGKAGGSTTAELCYMRIFGLICKSYELEVTNLNHLTSIGLGMELDPANFVTQLKELLHRDKDNLEIEVVDWQKNIERLI